MIIEKYDWKFDIDIQRTKLIYENRLDNIINKDKQLSELTNFFMNQAQILKNLIAMIRIFQRLYIHVYEGHTQKMDMKQICMKKNQFISIVIYNEDNIVTLEVFGIKQF